MRSVLLIDDQRVGRFPDRCVLSGERTNGAVRVTAVRWSGPRWPLGFPGVVPVLALRGARHRLKVALPVSRVLWRRWQRRSTAALGAIAFGSAFIAIGALRDNGLVGLGIPIVLAAVAYRMRVAHIYWVTCRLDPGRGTITVEPAHPDFDSVARELFERSLYR